LTPAEPQSNKGTGEQPSKSARSAQPQGKWILTQQAFDRLLASLSPDREEAGKQYEIIRLKLVRFFEWRSSGSPEDHADETINRVARKISEGETITNLNGYCYGVAKLVFMEVLKEQERLRSVSRGIPTTIQAPQLEDDRSNRRLRCFDRCLDRLPPESRNLIVEYYQEERRAKIELRKQLAERLSIPLNALRIRAHRVRISLEECVTECLGQQA